MVAYAGPTVLRIYPPKAANCHILFRFFDIPCIVPTRSLDGTSDRATTLLDI